MPFRGIWNDPRNLQGSLGEILIVVCASRPPTSPLATRPTERSNIAWRPVFSFSSL